MKDIPNVIDKTAFSIVLYVAKNPNAIQSQISEAIAASGNTIALALKDLMYTGLIKEERGKYNRKHLSLTEKGSKVADLIKQIIDVIDSK